MGNPAMGSKFGYKMFPDGKYNLVVSNVKNLVDSKYNIN